MNTIVRGDNLDIMTELRQTGTLFDLILTDPPYGVGKDFGNGTDKLMGEDFYCFLQPRVTPIYDLMTPTGSVIWFCSQRHIFECLDVFKHYSKMNYQRMMMWHYKNGMSRQTNSPVTEFEPLLWYTKDNEKWTYNTDDVRVPYRSERVKNPVYKMNKAGERIAWMPDPRGAKRGDVWEYPCLAGALYQDERTEHPTQKPESLIIDLLRAFMPKGKDGMYEGSVLDPFIGSGTTAVCCEWLNQQGHRIQWMGIELEQKWVDVGNQRLDAMKQQQSIL